MEKMRLFVDMDGTLACWNPIAEEQIYEKGYYRNLKPHTTVIEAIKHFATRLKDYTDVYILTQVLKENPYAKQEKNEWLDEYLPEVEADKRIFVPYGEVKADYLIKHYSPITPKDILIDDFTPNLKAFCKACESDKDDIKLCCGIKLLNGLNGTHGTWNGSSVSMFGDKHKIIDTILLTVEEKMIIREDDLPQNNKNFIKNGVSTDTFEIKRNKNNDFER